MKQTKERGNIKKFPFLFVEEKNSVFLTVLKIVFECFLHTSDRF